MTNNNIVYKKNINLQLDDVKAIYNDSKLGQKRPIHDDHRLILMLEHANLIITAWDNDTAVGICRCMTDFSYITYIADLAVVTDYQKQGIGKKMISMAQTESGGHTKVVLLSAPNANDYYPHIGFKPHPRAWTIEPES